MTFLNWQKGISISLFTLLTWSLLCEATIKKLFWNRQWLWIVLLLAFSMIFSYWKLIPLKEGGEVTWFSMLFLYLIGYFYGGWKGLLFAILYGGIKFGCDYGLNCLDKTHLTAELVDYITSYGIVGIGGFVASPLKKKERIDYLDDYNV